MFFSGEKSNTWVQKVKDKTRDQAESSPSQKWKWGNCKSRLFQFPTFLAIHFIENFLLWLFIFLQLQVLVLLPLKLRIFLHLTRRVYNFIYFPKQYESIKKNISWRNGLTLLLCSPLECFPLIFPLNNIFPLNGLLLSYQLGSNELRKWCVFQMFWGEAYSLWVKG